MQLLFAFSNTLRSGVEPGNARVLVFWVLRRLRKLELPEFRGLSADVVQECLCASLLQRCLSYIMKAPRAPLERGVD